MAIHLFVQRFRDGVPSPMPYPEAVDCLEHHGTAGRPPFGDLEIDFRESGIALRAFVVGDARLGALCIAFFRPTFNDDLRRLVFELMARFEAAVFDDALDCVYVTENSAPLPAALADAAVSVQRVGSPAQLWPATPSPDAEPPILRPTLRYTNPNPRGPNIMIFDRVETSASGNHHLHLDFDVRAAACNEGTLRALRNTLLVVDDALVCNPDMRASLHFADPEASLLLLESPPITHTRVRISYVAQGITATGSPEQQLYLAKTPLPADEQQAWKYLSRLLQAQAAGPGKNLWERLFKGKAAAGSGLPDPIFIGYLRRLLQDYPGPCEFPDDLSGRILSLKVATANIGLAIETAQRESGLTVFDVDNHIIYGPPKR